MIIALTDDRQSAYKTMVANTSSNTMRYYLMSVMQRVSTDFVRRNLN